MSLTETRQFDPRFGIATQVTDPNGVYVTKLLDGFGRVYGERRYNQANQKIGETFSAVETTGIAGNERYRQRQKASGGGEVEVYFDELQREVRRRSKAFIDGTYATTTLAYDAAGRKSSATKPAGGGTLTTAWSYDTLNRLAAETMAGTGLTLTSSYAYRVTPSLTVDGATVGPLKSVSITQTGTGIASRTNVKYSNSQGQAVRVTDGLGNNTDFAYDAIGNLTKAAGPTGIAEVMGYDLRGRKVSLANPPPRPQNLLRRQRDGRKWGRTRLNSFAFPGTLFCYPCDRRPARSAHRSRRSLREQSPMARALGDGARRTTSRGAARRTLVLTVAPGATPGGLIALRRNISLPGIGPGR